MKTPIQEAIATIKEYRDMGTSDIDTCNTILLHLASMLKKEKEVMCEFQDKAHFKDFWVKYEGSEDCFDKTFNTKEK